MGRKKGAKKQKISHNHTPKSEIHNVWHEQPFHYILSFLPPQEIYVNYSQVCSHWKEVTKSEKFWANQCYSKWPSEKDLIDIQKKEGQLSFAEIYLLHPWWVWRYHHGEPGKNNQLVFKQVWEEMESVKLSMLSKRIYNQVDDVVIETMKRVKFNMKLLESRLKKYAYPKKEMLKKVNLDDIKKVENKTGNPVPLVLRRFWEIVGSINLVANYDDRMIWWKAAAEMEEFSDNALLVNPPIDYFADKYEHGYYIILSSDQLNKNNVSGSYYECCLEPSDSVKLKVAGETDYERERTQEVEYFTGNFSDHIAPTFVAMLRQSLDYAGFSEMRNVKSEKGHALVKELKADFLLF